MRRADWSLILAHLDLVAFDMARHLGGLRLTTVLNTYTWREFRTLVNGLLGLDEFVTTPAGVQAIPATSLGALFQTTDDDEEPDDE